MNFLSPWMLLGVLGAAIPILVHLQGRRKAKVIPFAALDFLLGTDKRLAKKLVLRQIALLIARVAICLVIPLVLAKPYASCSKQGPIVAEGPQAAILLVDNSIASGYEIDGQSLLSRSIEDARDIVSKLGAESEVAIVTTTELGSSELSRDHMLLRTQLGRMEGNFQSPRMQDAIARSTQLLSTSGHEKRTIFVLAAPTQRSFPKAIESPDGITIRVVSPIDEDLHRLDNLAITSLDVVANGNIGDRGISIVAQVKNFSDSPRQGKLTLEIGSAVVARGEIFLEAGQSKKKRFSANLSGDTRRAEISVSLGSDKLVADNKRYLVADYRDQVPVLLVNGDPRTIRHEDELYYLEAALRPGDRAESGTSIVVSSPDELSDTELDGYDVIVLANVDSLSEADTEKLAEWVRAGGGLFVSVGDNVNPREYNRRMGPLLAQELRSALDLRSGQSKADGKALRLSKIESGHPIFSLFTQDAPGLYNATFDQVMLLGTTTSVKDRKVLARYTNGGAALVETNKGKGHLLLFTSTLDRDWNNLAIHPGFLPFIQSTIRYLAAKPLQRQNRDLLVGQSIAIKLSPTDTRLEIAGPADTRLVLEGDKVRNRKNARLDGVDLPGFYHVQSRDDDGELRSRAESSFAVNVDTSASDLRMAPQSALVENSGSSGHGQANESFRRVELWHGVAAGLLFFLMLESILGIYGSRNRDRTS